MKSRPYPLVALQRAFLTLCVVVLAGCAAVSQVKTGEVLVRERMAVTVDKVWNQFEGGFAGLHPTWTQDGFTVDALSFYVALKDSALLAPTPSQPAGQKPLAFKATMSPADAVALFEAMYSRGGSTFTLSRVTPVSFAGQPGVRFEWQGLRRDDDARLQGVGWITVRNGELFAITYVAPRLAFFARHLPSAEAIAQSAKLR